jgi:hypothetical protein
MSVSAALPIAGLLIWPFSTPPATEQPSGGATLTLGDDGLYDIYGPLKLSEFPYLPVILVAIAVICLIALLLYLRRRKRPRPVSRSTGACALAELDAIQALIDQPLAYMEKIADILRRYLETRFAITSTSRTTGELLLALRQDKLPADARLIDPFAPTLTACLEYSDRAKFAHRLPDCATMMEFQSTVRDFIEQTASTPHGEEQT